MDEPLSNLDAKLRVQMRADIAHLQKELGHDDDVRHARPGRGDDDGRPRRGDEQGRAPAGRRAAAAVRPPAEPVRRRVHRHAADEPARVHGVGERRRLDRPRRQPDADRRRRRSPTTRACAARDGRQGDRRAPRRRPAPGAGARTTCRRSTRGCSSSSRSAASRWRTSRSNARSLKSEAAEEEEMLESEARRDGRRRAAEPRRVVPAARPAAARRPTFRSRSTRRTSTSSTRHGCAASVARLLPQSRWWCSLAGSGSVGSAAPPSPARAAAALAKPGDAELARVPADLLRDARPVRERRPGQRPRRADGRAGSTGYDPADTGYFHGGDLKGLTAPTGHGSSGSGTSASPRSGSRRVVKQQTVTTGSARLPRLLGARLHHRRPAPRHRRRTSPRSSQRAHALGLKVYHRRRRQPHRRHRSRSRTAARTRTSRSATATASSSRRRPLRDRQDVPVPGRAVHAARCPFVAPRRPAR